MARLDFLWQLQARDEKLDMEALQVGIHIFVFTLKIIHVYEYIYHIPNPNHHQSSNRRILFNLLPAHVATHFLDNQFRSNMVNNLILLQLYSSLVYTHIRICKDFIPHRDPPLCRICSNHTDGYFLLLLRILTLAAFLILNHNDNLMHLK